MFNWDTVAKSNKSLVWFELDIRLRLWTMMYIRHHFPTKAIYIYAYIPREILAVIQGSRINVPWTLSRGTRLSIVSVSLSDFDVDMSIVNGRQITCNIIAMKLRVIKYLPILKFKLCEWMNTQLSGNAYENIVCKCRLVSSGTNFNDVYSITIQIWWKIISL